MTKREIAILATALIAPIVGVLILGYRSAQGSQRAESILRWATVPVYVGTALIAVLAIVAISVGTLWLWVTIQLTKAIADQPRTMPGP